MKLTCPKSGIRFTVSCGFGSAKAIHPIFQLSLEKLLVSNYPAFLCGKLDRTDLHLFGTVLLDILPIDRWSTPLSAPEVTNTIWYQTIPKMVQLCSRLYDREFKRLPKFRINKDTNNLKGLPDYLMALEACLDKRSFSPVEDAREQAHKQTTDKIYKILRDTEATIKNRRKLPKLIAQYASIAGDFPQSNCQWQGQTITIREFWKSLIELAFDPDNLKVIKLLETKSDGRPAILSDYDELLEWCETKIPFGNIHYDTLQQKLKDTIAILEEFSPQVQEIDSDKLKEEIKESNTYINGHNGKDLIEPLRLPSKEPKRSEFTSNLAYIKAKIKWSNAVLEYRDYKDKYNV